MDAFPSALRAEMDASIAGLKECMLGIASDALTGVDVCQRELGQSFIDISRHSVPLRRVGLPHQVPLSDSRL